VLLSDGFGPALLGVRRPRVVVPTWALQLEPERLRLVVLHEKEHRAAGDARALLAGALAVVAAPWNAALWWQLRGLRAAVELDCDARVLRRGVSPAAYGAVLLDLGARVPGLPLVAPVAALSNPPTLLERRLRMIVRGAGRTGTARALAAAGAAVLLVAVACEAPSPTAVRPGSDDDAVAAKASVDAVQAGSPVGAVGRDGRPMVILDGKRVGAFPDLDPAQIERIEVLKGEASHALFGDEAANGVVEITTRGSEGVQQRAARERRQVEGRLELLQPKRDGRAGTPGEDGEAALHAKVRRDAAEVTEGVPGLPKTTLYVDGEPFMGDPGSLDRSTIDRVDVVKGPHGSTIHITTKKAARGGGDE
jgi:TonB-dependent SusC/RagA subfamily outer membrane receptor